MTRVPQTRRLYEEPDDVERAILQLVAEGKSHREIGAALHYHEGAVGHILVDLARRWRVTTRQLLVLAGVQGWATLPRRHPPCPPG